MPLLVLDDGDQHDDWLGLAAAAAAARSPAASWMANNTTDDW